MDFIEEILKEAKKNDCLRGRRLVSRIVAHIKATDKNCEFNSDVAFQQVVQLTKLIREFDSYEK